MTWNYRVIRKDTTDGEYYGIFEVYYDSSGNPEMVTVDPIGPAGDTPKELRQDLAYMLAALRLPVLNYEDIP